MCQSSPKNLVPRLSLLAILLILAALPAMAQTNISGNVSGVLTLNGHPYTATGSLTVPTGLTLTVEPGVIIYMADNTSFTVNGTLQTSGTEQNPVIISSTAGEPGAWFGLFPGAGSSILLNGTWIEHAGRSGYGGIHTNGSATTEIIWNGGGARHCGADGITATAGAIEIRNCQFHSNAGDGCEVRSTGQPAILEDIEADNNGGYALRIMANPGDILGGLSGSGNQFNGIYVSGDLNGSPPGGSWLWAANQDFPILVNTVTIGSGNHLRIQNGAVIKFVGNTSNITVNGGHIETLDDGGSRAQTWFTALADDSVGGDTNGDGPSGGAANSHFGLFLQNGSTATLHDTYIAFGGTSGYAGMTTTAGAATALNWDGGGLLNNGNDGMRVTAVDIDLRNLEIVGNGQDGFELLPTNPPVLHNITSNSNGAYSGRINQNPGHLDGTISGTGSTYNGVYVSGNLGGGVGNMRWIWDSADNMPVIINTVTAAAGDTLELAPGMVAKFNGNTANLTCVAGSVLLAPGGEDVWFTSLADDSHGGDTNNDGSATSPTGSQGFGVFLQNDSRAFLNDFWIAYCGTSGYAGITTTAGSAEVLHWNGGGAHGNSNDGVRVNADDMEIRNLTLSLNGVDGLELAPNTPPVLENIIANGNGGYGVRINQNPGHIPDSLTGSGNNLNGTYVTGNLGGTGASGAFSWSTDPGFPIIVGSVTVAAGDSLIAQPGTIIKTSGNTASITVSGLLEFLPGSPSWFTSLADDNVGGDTNNDGNATSPAGAQGFGIFVQNESVVRLNDFWVGYQGTSGYAGLTTTAGSVAEFSWDGGGAVGNAGDGARVNAASIDVRNLELTGNGGDGFEMSPGTSPVLDNIIANGNGGYGLRINQNPGDLNGTITGSGNGINGIYVNGNLGGSANRHFSWASGYAFPVVLGAVSMAADDTLTCQPGLVVKYAGNTSSLSAYGTLLAPGGYPVWFTSLQDDLRGGDTNNDGNATSPSPASGFGIFINSNSHVDINDFWMAYGGTSGYAHFTGTSGTTPFFRWHRGGSVLCQSDGLRVNTSNLDLNRLRLVDNAGDGLEVSNNGSAEVHDCDISGNGGAGIRSITGTTVNAQSNWWGDPSGPLDTSEDNPQVNPSGLGDQAVGWVAYEPWLLETPANQAPTDFICLDPDPGAIFTTGPINFTWTESTDPDGEGVLYNLEISRNAEFTDVYIYKGDIPALGVTIDASELEPDHTSWWRVIARDGFFGETIAQPYVRAIIQGTGISTVEDETVISFAVGRSWPNPSSQGSRLSFSLPGPERVAVDVFDIRGRLVRTVTDQVFTAGHHTLQWDGRDRSGQRSADGMYFYRVRAQSGERVRKIMLVK